MTEFQIIAIF